MNSLQTALQALNNETEPKRPGRPRKWQNDAERMRVGRAEQKKAEQQKEQLDPEYWERILIKAGLGVDRGKNLENHITGKKAVLVDSGGYDGTHLAEMDAARQRSGMLVSLKDSEMPDDLENFNFNEAAPSDDAFIGAGGRGRKIPVVGNPDDQETGEREPEIKEAFVYSLFNALYLEMRVCVHDRAAEICFCRSCRCLVLQNGTGPFPCK